jgi:hypothetical protein
LYLGDFDIEFQHRIFDRIASNQISLKEDDKAREKMSKKASGGLFGGGNKLKLQQEVGLLSYYLTVIFPSLPLSLY